MVDPLLRHRPAVVTMPTWGVGVFESHHADNFRMPISRHDPAELVYVLAGRGEVEIVGTAHSCEPGDVLFVPSNQPHRILDGPGHPLSVLGVRIAAEPWTADALALLPPGRLPRDTAASALVRAEVRRLLYEQEHARLGQAAVMRAIVLQLLVTLARQFTGPSRRSVEPRTAGDGTRALVESYAIRLTDRFMEPITLNDVASELGLSRRRFTDLFRAVTGTTWAERVRQLRITHAQELLRGTDRSIVAIAFAAGFEDLSSFYRVFRQVVGVSPQRWREQATQ